MKTKKKRSKWFYIGLAVVATVAIFIVVNIITQSLQHNRTFSFNSESDYWPTKGWLTSTPEKQGMDSAVLANLFRAIREPSLKRKIKGKIAETVLGIPAPDRLDIDILLIIRNGYIVTEAYSSFHSFYGIRDKDSLNPIYSSTKSFISAIFGIAKDQGKMTSLDSLVLDFFPDETPQNLDKRKRALKLKHLLTMTCGFDWPELKIGYSNPENPVHQMRYTSNWSTFVLDKPMVQDPGETFNYNSGCTQLLTSIIHKQTSGDSLGFAQKHLFQPLGISNFTWRSAQSSADPDSKAIVNGSGGLLMRARDMAKFGYLYLKGGIWDGQEIVSRKWVEESTRRHNDITGIIGTVIDDYGYLWYIHSFGFHSLGYSGQYIFVIPDLEIVAVFLSDLNGYQVLEPIFLVEDYIIPAVKNSHPIPENPNALVDLKKQIDLF
jgi:CubicO group peptidase (beta-lactamase class C family)